MKLLIILALVALAIARPEDSYDKYENFDVDVLISNARLFKSYVQCFLGTGKCTPEGNDFKKWIPEVIQTSCGKCSEKQKTLVAKVIKANIEKLPEEWEQLNKINNPDGAHDEKLKVFLEKYGN